MHPLLRRPGALPAYAAASAAAGAVLAVLFQAVSPGPLGESLAVTVPLSIVLFFQCLAVWYPVRSLPFESTPPGRLAASLAGFAAVSLAVWLLAGWLWTSTLQTAIDRRGIAARFTGALALFVAFGLSVHVLAVLGHYLVLAVERSRRAERRALEAQLLARDAELKSLRAQLDPHFLFNSLNSVAALTGSDPAAARRMCGLLAGFFRKSLALTGRPVISLGEEIALTETYLAVEEVRFGRRLRSRIDVPAEARATAVPPLLLQPLVENAVHHGIAHLVDGGEIRLDARLSKGELRVAVENPCDPDRPAADGAGLGLGNVRARLEALHGQTASISVESAPGRFRVELRLPPKPGPAPI
jgi:two-component system sensor histidine kinase AlgZ